MRTAACSCEYHFGGEQCLSVTACRDGIIYDELADDLLGRGRTISDRLRDIVTAAAAPDAVARVQAVPREMPGGAPRALVGDMVLRGAREQRGISERRERFL